MDITIICTTLIALVVILVISLMINENRVDDLKLELIEAQEKLEEMQEEYEYYYKLASVLWEQYRYYDIFPSKLSREISKFQ